MHLLLTQHEENNDEQVQVYVLNLLLLLYLYDKVQHQKQNLIQDKSKFKQKKEFFKSLFKYLKGFNLFISV
jgi:hypothetical protein